MKIPLQRLESCSIQLIEHAEHWSCSVFVFVRYLCLTEKCEKLSSFSQHFLVGVFCCGILRHLGLKGSALHLWDMATGNQTWMTNNMLNQTSRKCYIHYLHDSLKQKGRISLLKTKPLLLTVLQIFLLWQQSNSLSWRWTGSTSTPPRWPVLPGVGVK